MVSGPQRNTSSPSCRRSIPEWRHFWTTVRADTLGTQWDDHQCEGARLRFIQTVGLQVFSVHFLFFRRASSFLLWWTFSHTPRMRRMQMLAPDESLGFEWMFCECKCVAGVTGEERFDPLPDWCKGTKSLVCCDVGFWGALFLHNVWTKLIKSHLFLVQMYLTCSLRKTKVTQNLRHFYTSLQFLMSVIHVRPELGIL